MKKILYLIPLISFSCSNSNPQSEIKRLRDSINLVNSKTELKKLKDSLNYRISGWPESAKTDAMDNSGAMDSLTKAMDELKKLTK
jgi:hypothetical protein